MLQPDLQACYLILFDLTLSFRVWAKFAEVWLLRHMESPQQAHYEPFCDRQGSPIIPLYIGLPAPGQHRTAEVY